ncbi:MAG TPA: esterase [Bradyrhizobium sp.]|nr:esterase [Bradyrhizobium sp.]
MPVHYSLVIEPAATSGAPLMLLLHGSGGTERDMVPLAARLSPGSVAVAIRGALPWENGFAFFRRFEDRSIDEDNLVTQAGVLANDIPPIRTGCRSSRAPIAVGFSNGAIMAAALLIRYPGLLSGAVLFRPLSPFARRDRANIPGTPVLIIDGSDDERRSPGDGARLARGLTRHGATVTHHVLRAGHSLEEQDLCLAREWLEAQGSWVDRNTDPQRPMLGEDSSVLL